MPPERANRTLTVTEDVSRSDTVEKWADRVEACLPAEHLRITVTVTGETGRRFTIEGRGDRYAVVVRQLASA